MSSSDIGCCDCALENTDILMMFLRCLLENNKYISKVFLARCYIGNIFDLSKDGILKGTASQINDDFTSIMSFMECSLCISVSVTIFIFTKSSDYEWKTIETHFSNIDSVGKCFLAFVVLVSFVNICLSIVVNLIQFIVLELYNSSDYKV